MRHLEQRPLPSRIRDFRTCVNLGSHAPPASGVAPRSATGLKGRNPGGSMPRTEAVPVVRLADYRPSDWLIDTVALNVSLHPTATRVVATLSLKPNPAGREGAPLALDGDELVVKA